MWWTLLAELEDEQRYWLIGILFFIAIGAAVIWGISFAIRSANARERKEPRVGSLLVPESMKTPRDSARKPQPMGTICANCASPIGALETPYVWKDHVVCKKCHDRLSMA